MEIGIDSFAAMFSINNNKAISDTDALAQLLERIVHADKIGLDVFGVGEHHRKGFLDSAPTLILAAAAVLTNRIRLTSAVTVLSAADPVETEAIGQLHVVHTTGDHVRGLIRVEQSVRHRPTADRLTHRSVRKAREK